MINISFVAVLRLDTWSLGQTKVLLTQVLCTLLFWHVESWSDKGLVDPSLVYITVLTHGVVVRQRSCWPKSCLHYCLDTWSLGQTKVLLTQVLSTLLFWHMESWSDKGLVDPSLVYITVLTHGVLVRQRSCWPKSCLHYCFDTWSRGQTKVLLTHVLSTLLFWHMESWSDKGLIDPSLVCITVLTHGVLVRQRSCWPKSCLHYCLDTWSLGQTKVLLTQVLSTLL